MYRAYINGELFGTSESESSAYLIASPSINVELNKSGSFECLIYPTNIFYDRLIKMKSYVEVFIGNKRKFSGRLLRTEVNANREMACYFEGRLSYLLDSVQDPGVYEETVADYFKRVIDTHNSQVDYEKQFEVGIVSIDEALDVETFEETRYTDTFSVLQTTFLNKYGGYLWIRDFGGKVYIDYVKDYDQISTQDLSFGENVLDVSDNISGEDIFTVLLPLGPSESVTTDDGTETTIMTIESVNNGNRYLTDPEMLEKYGWIVKVQSFDNAESPEDLLEQAKKFIEDNCTGLPETITVKSVDLGISNSEERQVELGDKVTVQSIPHKLRKELVCIRIEYNLAMPWESTYELGTPIQDLSQKYSASISSIGDSIQDVNRVVERVTSVIVKNGDDIKINARDIEINARDIQVNARNIAIQAEEISLKASKTQVDEIHNRTTNLEAEIKIQAGEIALRATTEQLDYIDQKHTGEEERLYTRLQNAEIRIGNGEINMSTLSANLYGEINRIDADYEKLSKEVDEVGESVTQAYIQINANKADIKLKADATVMEETQKRVSSAEIDIDALQSKIELKVDKDGVIAAIRLSPESVQIQASKINLTGYVTASQLEAVDAKFEHLSSGSTTAQSLKTFLLSASEGFVYQGHSCAFYKVTIDNVTRYFIGY